jgi:hypothetical protein
MTSRLLRAILVASLVTALPAAAQPRGAGGPAVGDTPERAARAAPKLKPPPPGVRDLKWDDMMPTDWNPRKIIEELGLDRLDDGDPRAIQAMERLRAALDRAPVEKSLDGQKVRLPGFVVMLEGDAKGVSEFLLVPYFGACIHVPPPPSNQVVHVVPAKLVPEKLAYGPVWVTGVLRTSAANTALGNAGYRIQGAQVEEYPWRR